MPTPLIASACPFWVEPHVKKTGSIVFGEAELQYLVLRASYAEKNGGPETFVMNMPNGLLAVSENYREEYIRPSIIHELLPHDAVNPFACRDALLYELDVVGQQELCQERYIEYRLWYFAIQLAYYEHALRSGVGIHVTHLRHTRDHLATAFYP